MSSTDLIINRILDENQKLQSEIKRLHDENIDRQEENKELQQDAQVLRKKLRKLTKEHTVEVSTLKDVISKLNDLIRNLKNQPSNLLDYELSLMSTTELEILKQESMKLTKRLESYQNHAEQSTCSICMDVFSTKVDTYSVFFKCKCGGRVCHKCIKPILNCPTCFMERNKPKVIK